MGLENNKFLVKLENTGVFQNNKWLVKGVSLEVEKGKIVTLIGPNGSGKTTTAKIALGLYKNIQGKVDKFTKKIGYVPQKISIDWTLPIRVLDFMLLTQNLTDDEINSLETITRFEYQKKYCSNQKLNDKTRVILSKFFGSSWTDEYIENILFSC